MAGSGSEVMLCYVVWLLTVNCALSTVRATASAHLCTAVSKTKFRHLDCILVYDVCFSNLGGEQSRMTDRERDQIDADAEIYMKTCVSAIQQLRTQGNN